MEIINIITSKHTEMQDITAQISALVPSGLTSGICHVFCRHTTAGLTINENADVDVQHDILSDLDRMVPWNNPDYRHAEGNSAAHLKASLLGFSVTIPIVDCRLALGTWQGVYFCEFDGPRRRQVIVQFIGGGKVDA